MHYANKLTRDEYGPKNSLLNKSHTHVNDHVWFVVADGLGFFMRIRKKFGA
jgi:hypothetical protein